jgi:hypothetical protein
VLAKLYVLQNDWDEFLIDIGGVQYLNDLHGVQKEWFKDAKNLALASMTRRRQLRILIDEGIKSMIQQVREQAEAMNKAIYNQDWDYATSIESEAEIQADLECAKRDADVRYISSDLHM